MGINGSGWSSAGWTINGAHDGYVYTQTGNFALGTANNRVLDFFTGGTLSSNRRLRLDGTGNLYLYQFAGPGGVLYGNTSSQVLQTTSGSTTQVLHGGVSPSFSAVVLTTDVSGVLPASNGGTGVNNGASATLTLSAFGYTLTTSGTTSLQAPTTGLIMTNTVKTGWPDEIVFNDISSSIGNNTYTLDLYATLPYTINALFILAGSGTCTAALQINGTNVTSISAVSVSTALATAFATGANTVSSGNKLTLVLSSTSSLNNLQGTVKITWN